MVSATAIRMPKFGMTMKEGTILEWTVPIDGSLDGGEVLVLVESEKAEVEVETPAPGFLRHIYVEPGETVACGTLLAALTETADADFDAVAFAREQDDVKDSSSEPAAPRVSRESAERLKPGGGGQRSSLAVVGVEAAGENRPKQAVAPAARALARKLNIDLRSVTGSGPGGRVTRADVQARADAREGLLTVAEGVALEVPTAGDGDPVCLLPGFGSDVSAYARQTPVFAQRYRVLGMNPRGVGLSDAPATDSYNPATIAADAVALLREPAHVIGASMGAAAAVELAIVNPHLVRSLTLITPALRATPRLHAILQAWCAVATAGPEVLARALLPWMFSDKTLADERVCERNRRGLAEILSRSEPEVLERYAAGFTAWAGSRDEDLARLEVPTLVLVAEEDLLIPDAAASTTGIPGVTVIAIPGSGHAVALEAPEVVNESILAHMASL